MFGFLRHRSFQARNAFAPIADPPFTRTQYGFTLGGPFDRDHTFFFFAFEQRRRNESGFLRADVSRGITSSVTIPVIPGLNPIARTFTNLTPAQVGFVNGALATGNPTAICGARAYAFFASSGGVTRADRFQPAIVAAMMAAAALQSVLFFQERLGHGLSCLARQFQQAQRTPPVSSYAFRPLNNLQSVFPVTDRTTFNSFRLDHADHSATSVQLLDLVTIQAKLPAYRLNPRIQSLGQNDFSRTGIQKLRDFSAVTTLTSTLSTRAINEARFNFGERRATFKSQNGDAVAFNISGAAFIGRELFSPVVRTETRYEFTDNVNLVSGNHNFKFGGDIAFVRIPEAIFELNFAGLFNFGGLSAATLNPAFAGAPDFTPVQQYGLGFPANYIQGFGDPVSRISNKPIAFFGQDSWKIRRI